MAADSEKPSDSSHEWRRPNVMASVASSRFCVKSSQQPAGTGEPGDPSPQSLLPKGDVVGIFPNRPSARRLVGAVLAEQHDEWAEGLRYLTIPTATSTQCAGISGPINIKRDDELLHVFVCCSSPVDRPSCGVDERGRVVHLWVSQATTLDCTSVKLASSRPVGR